MSRNNIYFTKEEFGRGSEYFSEVSGLHYFLRDDSTLCVSVIAGDDITMFVRPIRNFSEHPVSDETLEAAVRDFDQNFADIIASYESEEENIERSLASDFVANEDGTSLLALKYPFLYEIFVSLHDEDFVHVTVKIPPEYIADNDFFRGFVMKDFYMVGYQNIYRSNEIAESDKLQMTLDEAYISIVRHAYVFGTLLEDTILN